MIIRLAPAPPPSNTAAPAMRGGYICSVIVAPAERFVTISLLNLDNDRIGAIVEDTLFAPFMTSLEPMSRDKVVLMW